MYTRSVKLVLVVLLVVGLGGTLPLWSQSASSGTVAGSVTDQSNAVVPAATVTLTDTSTNIARTTSTNKDGRYIFVDVTPGIYDIAVAKSGFATTKTAKQEVKVGESLTVNLSLQVGGANVVVEVQATGTELQTMNATVGNTVTAIAIDNLPSIGRDVNTFIELQPGVSTGGDVAGAVNDQSYFSLDGGNNTNDMDGNGEVYLPTQTALIVGDPTGGVASGNGQSNAPASGVMPTPADSVEEFKVNTAGQTADFNSSAGAEIKVVTKRGTDAFHGTAYEYYKDNNWSSNYWQNNELNFIPGDHVGLPSYHYSRFGFAVGGPLIPKAVLGGKTYFFVNYEGFRYPNSETVYRNVPSPALQAGLLLDDGPTTACPSCVAGTVDYNLNNAPVTYNGNTYPANYGCTGLCDPQGLGLNPLVSQIWSTYEPASNASCNSGNGLCDGQNILGYAGTLSLPITSKFGVGRIDHDFSSKQHFVVSYRYYNMKLAGDQEVDIGGFFPGDTKGTPASEANDPIQDWYLVAGLTTNITTNTTNDFHYSWLRNWWAWSRGGAPPQIAGLGGALEIMAGQSQTQDLSPFNSNNQDIRRRFWDGHDQMIRDDVSNLHGNHLIQFGGMYQHNFDYHQRNDSGGTINAFPVYSLGDGSHGGLTADSLPPCAATTTNIENCNGIGAAALGVVSIASQVFTRSGTSLSLNPPLSNAFDKSTIPYYNIYVSDTWHMKPTFTLTYGLGWTLEMPPTEANGKQTVVVDSADEPVKTEDYLAARARAALQGNAYNPELGFALVGNVANGEKYPYNPFYGELSPRVAVAWNPRFDGESFAGRVFGHQDTVMRFGYGRQYGRLNGVGQVLLPLLGLGLEQPIACQSNLANGGSWACGASGAATFAGGANQAFRVGSATSATGGPVIPLISEATATLPQPVYPGYNNPPSSEPSALDPSWRPNVIDSFDFTIQRQMGRRMTMELGYIGRRITKDFVPINLNSVPHMMTLGGQRFDQAYANLVLQYCGGLSGLGGGGCGGTAGPNLGAVTPQAFFETALGPHSAYCTTAVGGVIPANCTQAVALNEGASGTTNLNNAQVWGLWSDLDGPMQAVNGGALSGPTMLNTPIASTCAALGGTGSNGCSGQYTSAIYSDTSQGWGNYNSGFVSVKMADWKGLTMQNNFTWAKALGTGAQVQASSELSALDPYNIGEMYGVQPWDRKFIFNTFFVYQPPFYKGQSGLMGRALGGWTFATIFAAGSGLPIQVATSYADYQSFGACDGVSCADYDSENAVPIGPVSPHSHAYYCVTPADGLACPGQAPGNGYPINEFKNGANEVSNFRNPILGLDTRDGGYGIIRGLPYWNVDFSIKKDILVAEGIKLEFQGVFSNILNHDQMLDGYACLCNATGFGSIGGEALPRNIELGLRVRF
ncbi:MAG: carboxypeptidase-like regulatory domain-containing protein [Candidatus Sulfotelmatobacter sp.]